MYIDFLNKDISHINRIPQVVKENRPAFFAFIKNICEYVNLSTKNIYAFISKINPIIAELVSSYDINFLRSLIDRQNIKLVYDLNNNASEQEKKLLYVTALQGAAIKRLSDSSKINLQTLLDTMYPGTVPATITDGGLDDVGKMTYIATINNYTLPVEHAFLSKYLQPNITGVQSQIDFNISGYFSSLLVTTNNEHYIESLPTESSDESHESYRWQTVKEEGDVYIEQNINTGEQAEQTGKWVLEII